MYISVMCLISLCTYDEFRVIHLSEMSSLNLLILFGSSLLFAIELDLLKEYQRVY